MARRAYGLAGALIIALTVGVVGPIPAAADQSTGICDLKVRLPGGVFQEQVLDVRVGQDYEVHGFGFPAATGIRIEFSTAGQSPELYDLVTDTGGAFVEVFSFTRVGPSQFPPQSWVLAVYDPADAGACIDFVNLWVHPATPFTDIDASPFRDDIEWIYNEGITKGCAATLYCPEGSVLRDQMASFLVRALGVPPTGTDFFDDDESSIHEGDINALAARGITFGCGTRQYCPKDPVRRDQMASFLRRAFGLPGSNTDFFDDDAGSIHEGDINALAQSGITTGCGFQVFCPGNVVTREQMAAFLHRASP
jgi:hypothetical protein